VSKWTKKAINNLDRAVINQRLDSYEGRPSIQAGFIAEFYKRWPPNIKHRIPQSTINAVVVLLEKIDALATTSLGIQGMSKELNRHMESYWTNTPLSPPTDP